MSGGCNGPKLSDGRISGGRISGGRLSVSGGINRMELHAAAWQKAIRDALKKLRMKNPHATVFDAMREARKTF